MTARVSYAPSICWRRRCGPTRSSPAPGSCWDLPTAPRRRTAGSPTSPPPARASAKPSCGPRSSIRATASRSEELGALRAREGDIAGAREAFERALATGANHADTLALLAEHVAGVLGRPDEAATLMDRAFALNPHAPSWYFFGQVPVAYFTRRFELALDAALHAPPLRTSQLFRVLTLAQLGREAEAATAALEFRSAYPGFRPAGLVAGLPLICPRARDLFLDGLRKARLDDEDDSAAPPSRPAAALP